MAQVFISYSRKDLTFVQQLVSDLKKTGIDVWFDLSGIEGGTRWRVEIQKAVKNSDYVIVVLSPDSIESEWVEREHLYANNLKKKILPLMYRECELPMSYLDLNYVDVQGENYSLNFDKITRFLAVEPLPETVTHIPATSRSSISIRTPQLAALLAGVAILAAIVMILLSNTMGINRVADPTAANTPVQLILQPTSSSEPDINTATEPPTSVPLTATITEPAPTVGDMNPSSPLQVDIDNQAVFSHNAAGANMWEHYTELEEDIHASAKDALVFAMPYFSGSSKIYNKHFLAVWYNGYQWAIVNQDTAAMRHNSEFHVRIVSEGENAFVHTAKDTNSENSWTVIEPPVSDPNALVFVMPTWSFNGIQMRVKEDHPIGVWYTGSQWAVINLDGAEMREGTAFNIQILSQSARAFIHKATSSNIIDHSTTIDDDELDMLDMAASKLVFVTPRGAPDGTKVNNTHPLGIWLYGAEWAIFNQLDDWQSAPTPEDAMPEGAEFNILILDRK